MSAREHLLAIIDARLTSVVGDGSYEAEPSADPDPESYPALMMIDGGERNDEAETDATRKIMSITVEGYVHGDTGVEARAARNALHADVVAALLTEPPLDGLATRIEEDGELRMDVATLASVRRLAFAQDFTIEFATRRGDPTTFA